MIIEVNANATTATFELNFYGANELDQCGDTFDFDCGCVQHVLMILCDSRRKVMDLARASF